MVRKTHNYGNASQVKCYADGGKVKSYGGPMGTPPPSKKRRASDPKPGDKSNDTRLKDKPVGKRPPKKKPEAKEDTRRVPAATRRRLKEAGVYADGGKVKRMKCGGKVKK